MRRVPPSALVREEIDRLLSGGVERGGNIVSELASLGLRYLAQQGLEQEQHDHLGRGRYERRAGDEEQLGWRNGYEDARIRTAEGAVAVRVPQVRSSPEPYRSRLMEFLSGNSEALEALVTEMYARGLSTRDVEDCFRDPDGELLISRTAVSEITDRLWEDYQVMGYPYITQLGSHLVAVARQESAVFDKYLPPRHPYIIVSHVARRGFSGGAGARRSWHTGRCCHRIARPFRSGDRDGIRRCLVGRAALEPS